MTRDLGRGKAHSGIIAHGLGQLGRLDGWHGQVSTVETEVTGGPEGDGIFGLDGVSLN